MSNPSTKKTFLALFLGGASEKEKAEVDEKLSAEFMRRWAAWANKHGDAILDPGAPLGPARRVDSTGASEEGNQVVTYSVVCAPSQDAASQMFLDHPHVELAEGNHVEIMERLPVPER